jgi:hypothetical protein
MRTYLLIDISNMLYRAFYANVKDDPDILISMCHHSALTSMQYLNRTYKPDEIVAVFDSHSWRKDYTKMASISHKKYKGTRRQNMTEREAEQLAIFDKHIIEFYEFLRDNTSLIVLKDNLLECDDLIAGFVDTYTDDKHIIISSDKDFMQLLNHPNVTLIEPDKETKRTLSDWNFDYEHFMFEKCLRGDTGDNVQSSYPRLQKKKIDAAYDGDNFLMASIMGHEFDVPVYDDSGNLHTKHYKTMELFEENLLLMGLRNQPAYIKKKMHNCINNAMNNRSKFNLIQFIKFCSRNQLERIQSNGKVFTKMLNTNSFRNSVDSQEE